MSEEIVEMHAIARGTVQGIGFRATTRRLATEFKLKGSVHNLPDGTVEIYAQGSRSQIDHFCQRMNNHWAGYMLPLEPTFLESLNPHEGFLIK